VTWHVAIKRAKRTALPSNKLDPMLQKLGQLEPSVRAKVEHPSISFNNLFRRKTRYRGLTKNTAQLFTLFGLANLVLAGRRFTVSKTRVAS
jgi:IS5 family transposase